MFFSDFFFLKKEQTTKKSPTDFYIPLQIIVLNFAVLANCCFVLKNNLSPCQ